MTRPRRMRPARTGGFTLIEVVVAVAILAVATALVLPAVGRGAEALRLRSAAGRVAAVLREARLRAVSQHRPARVALDRTRNTVVLTGSEPDRPLREIELAPDLYLRVAAGGDTLTFSPRGITRETRWIIEAPGGRRLSIQVDAVSGRVRVVPEGRS